MAKVGRPLLFKDKETLENAIESYFESCFEINEEGKRVLIRPLTVTGLAVFLDTSRETLINYEKKDEFFDTIQKAKERIQNYVEEYLFVGKNTAGAIFNLVNNYGWSNKNQTDITSKDEKIETGVVILPSKNESSLETTTKTGDSSTE